MAEKEFVTPGKGKKLSEKNLEYLRDGELYATYKELGIEASKGGVGEVPVSNGVPRIFLVKDGKVSTLAENNMKLGSEAYYNAMYNGQVFAYPPGEKNPVQMQLRMGEDENISVHGALSAPLEAAFDDGKMRSLALPPEPPEKPKAKWYHRAFKFFGKNRQICEEYDKYRQDFRKWEEKCQQIVEKSGKEASEKLRVGSAIRDAFGAKRTEAALRQEKAEFEELKKRDAKLSHLQQAKKEAKTFRHACEIAYNVYAPYPHRKDEWTLFGRTRSGDIGTGLYTKEEFDKLSKTDIDLGDAGHIRIGGRHIGEMDFASLAMFAALDPEIGVATQKVAVGDPTEAIRDMTKLGYTELEAKNVITATVSNSYTTDVLHGDGRMCKYFETAMNGGRARAAEALREYPRDKTKLAEILADAVEHTGRNAGTTTPYTAGGDEGTSAMALVAMNVLELMERDPELETLARSIYQTREEEFCKRHPEFQARTFDEHIHDIHALYGITMMEQKGLNAALELQEADMQGQDLPREQKRELLGDILRSNVVCTMYKNEVELRGKLNRDTGVNTAYYQFNERIQKLTEEPEQDGTGVAAVGGGSSLPAKTYNIMEGGHKCRLLTKPPALYIRSNPQEMERVNQLVDELIEHDKLLDLPLGELATQVKRGRNSPYTNDRLMAKVGKMAAEKGVEASLPSLEEPKRKLARPETNKNDQQTGI